MNDDRDDTALDWLMTFAFALGAVALILFAAGVAAVLTGVL